MFVGVRQGRAARRFGDPQMHQSPQTAGQTVADLAQGVGASQLTEQHGDELRPTGEALGVTLGGVLLHQRGKLRSREVLEQLIEQACDLYDWIALLWAACGEAPAKERLANVNYRRALLPISDSRNLFWTRVNRYPDLDLVVEAYNALVTPDLQVEDAESKHHLCYRQIQLWKRSGFRTHYEFVQDGKYIGVELHVECEDGHQKIRTREGLRQVLKKFGDHSVADGWTTKFVEELKLPRTAKGFGLAMTVPCDQHELAARMMAILVNLTRHDIAEEIEQGRR